MALSKSNIPRVDQYGRNIGPHLASPEAKNELLSDFVSAMINKTQSMGQMPEREDDDEDGLSQDFGDLIYNMYTNIDNYPDVKELAVGDYQLFIKSLGETIRKVYPQFATDLSAVFQQEEITKMVKALIKRG